MHSNLIANTSLSQTFFFPLFRRGPMQYEKAHYGCCVYVAMQTFQGQATAGPTPAVSHPPAIRPRVRARRGQATDPHSIAERVSLTS